MIKSVTVTNYSGESLVLELGAPEKSGFLVQRIEGLGPTKADIHITESATADGSTYNSARATSRNIVLSVQFLLLPPLSVEDIRQESYRYFPLKKRVRLLFETDNRTCYTYGYVESNDPDIFSQNVSATISIICPDPYFYSLTDEVTVFAGIVSQFELQFSNESLSDDLIEFGQILNLTTQTVLYTGDADTGVIINVHAIGPASDLTIYNANTRETMVINTTKLAALTGFGIITGDDIIISTIKGDRSIILLREGIYTNILNCLDRDSSWIRLIKGDNLFAYTATSGASNLQFRVNNQIAYEGV